MHAFTLSAFADTIIVLFTLQLIFQTHFCLKTLKEVAVALGIRVFCSNPGFYQEDEENDPGKQSSVSSGGRKNGGRRQNSDT